MSPENINMMRAESEHCVKVDIGYTEERKACAGCEMARSTPRTTVTHNLVCTRFPALGYFKVSPSGTCNLWKKADSPCG